MDLESKIKINKGFIPNFCDVGAVFMLLLMVELLSVLLALASSEESDFWSRLALISFFAQWLGLVNASLLCVLKNWLNRQTVKLCTAVSFIMMLIITFCFSLVVVYFGDVIGLVNYVEPSQVTYFVLRDD